MASSPNSPQTFKSQQIRLQQLLAGKQLRNWTSADVILWLRLVNDGLFSKYTDIFLAQKINGQTLMTLDNNKLASELLGTQHQINTFVQSIKQLKQKNGRKMSIHRRRQSRRGQSMQTLPFHPAQLQLLNSHSLRDLNTVMPRASTPTVTKTRKYRSRASSSQQRQQQSATPTHSVIKTFPFSTISPRSTYTNSEVSPVSAPVTRQRSYSHGDEEDPTDKKSLWKLYKSKKSYSGILFKRGKFHKSFKKRWLVLCHKDNKQIHPWKKGRQLSASLFGGSKSVGCSDRDSNDEHEYEAKYATINITKSNTYSFVRKKKKTNLKIKNNSFQLCDKHNNFKGYLFYFNERPIKDNDFPNGFIDLSSVECIIGLFYEHDNENKHNESDKKHKKIKYLKKKSKDSKYYEIVLKTADREWIFGAIDSTSYVEWLIRLKKFEHK